MQGKPKIIIICGPTATGKSDLAVELALFMQKNPSQNAADSGPQKAEIISADSRQIYKGLDIGTGKITHAEMKGIPHHMLDIVDPMQIFSVAEFKEKAESIIAEIHARGNIPILCGGTGQYIDAVIFNQKFPEVEPDEKLRAELEAKSIEEVTEIFHHLNRDKDGNPQPHNVDMQNKRRIIRAIEILRELGHIPHVTREERFDTLWIGIDADDEILKDRIARRIDSRLARGTSNGMIEESENLLTAGKVTLERMQKLGLEYAHIAEWLALPAPERTGAAMSDFKTKLNYAIWHYAKRQRTWFRRNSEIHWLMSGSLETREEAEMLVRSFLN
jgi:tRNA dimethylallyltransferase